MENVAVVDTYRIPKSPKYMCTGPKPLKLTLLRGDMLNLIQTQWQRHRNLLPRELRISTSMRNNISTEETKPHLSDSELAIPGMTLLRGDRISRGVGAASYHSKQLLCKGLTDEDLMLSDTLWCSMKTVAGNDCVVGVIFRPPSAEELHNYTIMERLYLVACRYK
ncbi:hypothetical protein X801_08213, partial [Opisthorchis viverrini]